MANRLKLKLEHMGMALDFAEQHIARQNFEGAVVVLHSAMKQLLYGLQGNSKAREDEMVTFEGHPVIERIKRISADVLDVSVKDIEGKRKTQSVSLARQCAVYYSRQAGLGVEEVASYFNRTHSSVSHTCTKIEDLLECDREMGAIIKLVGKKIRGKE